MDVTFDYAIGFKIEADANVDINADADIDKMVDTIISSSDEYENKVYTVYADKNKIEEVCEPLELNDIDNMSVSSEIIFTCDGVAAEPSEKKIKKNLKMSLEKLKEECKLYNINSEGTKNELIARLLGLKKLNENK